MSGTWMITSWSVPYADKRFALFWLAEDFEKRDFARNRTGAVKTFVNQTSARATRSRLNRQSRKDAESCNKEPLS